MLDDLQLAEFIYEQPAVGDVEYTFKHALTQEVAYNSVLMERRKPLHERTGAAIEALYAEPDRRPSGRARASLRSQRQCRQGGRVSGPGGPAGDEALTLCGSDQLICTQGSNCSEACPTIAERVQRELRSAARALARRCRSRKGSARRRRAQASCARASWRENGGNRAQLFARCSGLRVCILSTGD